MNLLGHDMLGNGDSVVEPTTPPYVQPYTPPYTPPAPGYVAPYEETGIYPLKRPPLPPLLPISASKKIIPPMPGPEYVQGPIGKIIPATHSPYPVPPIVSDTELIKVLVSKNIYHALKQRGLPTVAMRRRELDENTRRQVEFDALNDTLRDLDLVRRGDIQSVRGGGTDWQYEAIKNKLLDAATLQSVMSRGKTQSWLAKGG